jgi:hypothetical protein
MAGAAGVSVLPTKLLFSGKRLGRPETDPLMPPLMTATLPCTRTS